MKSKDPDCKIPISREEFRCFKCNYPSPKDKGGWNEVEPGLRVMVCDDCYKPKKDSHVKEEILRMEDAGLEASEQLDMDLSPVVV